MFRNFSKIIILFLITALVNFDLSLMMVNVPAAQAQNETKNEQKQRLKDKVDNVIADVRDVRFMTSPGAKKNGVISIDNYDAYLLTSEEGYYGLMKVLENSPSDKIPQEYQDLPPYDLKIIRSLLNMVTPKSVGGEEQEWLKIKTIVKGYNSENKLYSQENFAAENDKIEDPVSAHASGKAIDVSEKDFLKCTQVYIDENEDPKVNREKSKAVKPLPIVFRYQDMANVNGLGSPGSGSGNSSNAMDNIFNNILANLTNGSPTFHGTIGQLPQAMVNQFLSQALSQQTGIDLDATKFPDFHGGLPYVVQDILNNVLVSESDLPDSARFGYDFASTIENLGAAVTSEIFHNGVAPSALKGNNLTELTNNIGREELAKKMLLPEGAISGNNSEEIMENIGRAKIGAVFGVGSALIGKNLSDNNYFKKSLGQALTEEYLNLAPDSFSSDNWNEVLSKAGQENFNARFSPEQLKISAVMLGVSADELSRKINNKDIAGLKILVGNQAIEGNLEFYQNSTFSNSDGQEITVNSRDEAFDLVDYAKPYYASVGQKPDWIEDWLNTSGYDYKADKAHIITTNFGATEITYAIYELEPDNNSGLYEKLLQEAQKESVTKKILNGEVNASLFARIGRDTVAKNLTAINSERQWIRRFLESGSIPQDGSGRSYIDTQVLGNKIGLKDRYDLARIFVENRGGEVFYRVGRVTLENSLNPSTEQYLEDRYLIGNIAEEGTKDYLNNKLIRLKSTVGQSSSELSSLIDGAQNELNKNLSSHDEQISILIRRQQQNKISEYLYKIGQIIKSSVNSQDVKNKALNLIGEMIERRDYQNLKEISQNAQSNLSLGINQQDIQNLFQNENSVNVNEFVKTAGLRAVSSMINSADFEDPRVKNALQYAVQYGPQAANYPSNYLQEIASRLDSKELQKAAKIFNFSLGLPKDTFTSLNLTEILSGNQGQTIKQAISLFSEVFDVDKIKIKGLFEGNTGNVDSLPFDKFLDGISGLMTSADQLKNIFSASSSASLADRLTQGVNALPNILGFFQILDGDEQDNKDFNKAVNLINQYWRNGNQIIGVLSDFKNLFGSNGFNVADAMTFMGSLPNTLKENSILKVFDSIKLDLGLQDSDMPDFIKKARIGNWLAAINNKTIGDWVNTVKNTFTFTFNNEEEKQLFNFGTQILTQGANQDSIYPIMDYFLHQDNKDIPLGFSKSMLSGDFNTMMGAAGGFLQNYANNPKHGIDPEVASHITPVFNAIRNNDWQGLTNEAKQYAKDWLTKPENWQKIFGDELPAYMKGPLLDGLTSGNFQSFINSAGNRWPEIAKGIFGQSFDKILGSELGTIGQLNNQFWQNPFKNIFGNNPFGENPGDISKYLGNFAEGAFNSMFSAVTGMLTGYLDPAFAGLEQSLGLPAGTFSGAINSIIPALFMPHFSIGMALLSYFLPIILNKLGLGPLAKIFGQTGGAKPKAEVWCAMDYYPVLEVGKDDKDYQYDIAFGAIPPATPYYSDEVSIDEQGLDKEKKAIGDGSGGVWKVYDNGKEHVGEFKLDNNKKSDNNSKILSDKMQEAAKFKVKQLTAELIRIQTPGKMASLKMLPMQIKTYKDESFSPQYLYKLDQLYGIIKADSSSDKIQIVKTMKDYMQEDMVRRGVFAEKYHIDNVHWGY